MGRQKQGSGDPAGGHPLSAGLARELRRFGRLRDLKRSQDSPSLDARARALLAEPRVFEAPDARPRLTSFVRVAQWNIERGSRLEGIVRVLSDHPVLRFADVLLLNEVDVGMVRSGNVDVARELGAALSAHAVLGVEFIELSKGVGKERTLPGENTTALHGNAILTRFPISGQRVVRLPLCEKSFESDEKRFGGRIGIVADLDVAGAALTVATTHLDVVNTPRCRARQMRAVLEGVDSHLGGGTDRGRRTRPVLIGGDLNTHTFARGGTLRTVRNSLEFLVRSRESLSDRLLRPGRFEPSLGELTRFGYETERFNDGAPTGRAIISDLDDKSRLPRVLRRWVMKVTGTAGLLLEFRLDWLAGRNIKVLGAGEALDAGTGERSIGPRTVPGLEFKGSPIADHDPIVVDVSVA